MNVRAFLSSVILLTAVMPVIASTGDSRIDLAGSWTVHIDRSGTYDPNSENKSSSLDLVPVRLPGALRDSGLGDAVGPETNWVAGSPPAQTANRPEIRKHLESDDYKMPFWLQPTRHYAGIAYYKREVSIPESWEGQRVQLWLERPHWRTKLWVDGNFIGADDSLATPHAYDLTEQLTPGKHVLLLSVNNALQPNNVGINSHSVSDHTQTAWNGVVGRLELRAEPLLALGDVQITPAKDARKATVAIQFKGLSTAPSKATVRLDVFQDKQLLGSKQLNVTDMNDSGLFEATVTFDRKAKRWDEFEPHLCELQITIDSDKGELSKRTIPFGIRQIETHGTQFVLNDRPLFLRGTLECCIFPLTGYPPTDVASWERIIRICKAHGLNHMRFHSWCPPEAAFVAADRLGFYYQVECSSWPNFSTSVGNGKPIDEWLYREGERVLRAYHNHPSFLLMAMGNEPAGPERGGQYLADWVSHFDNLTDCQLVTGGSGWPSIAENQFHVIPEPRIQRWGEGLRSRINGFAPATLADYSEYVRRFDVPVISHEIGQWCVYPNFDEMRKYHGSLKPRNFEIFRDLLDDAAMLDQANDFLMASGKLQVLCYKEEIESSLRTRGFGGFQLLDLRDFPGQGTALVGMVDPFWDPKPYMTSDEFSRFCGPTVPLARMAKRSWSNDETFAADLEIAHFGPKELQNAIVKWNIERRGHTFRQGDFSARSITTGSVTPLGTIEVPLDSLNDAQQLKLHVWIDGQKQVIHNDWNLWVFPSANNGTSPDSVLVVNHLNHQATQRLRAGGRVVLLLDPESIQTDIELGFSPIFWNTAWTKGQPPHTLGLLCDPKHPALAKFPTSYHSDWQWWDVIHQSRVIEMDSLPPQLRPIVQVVPDWFKPQKLGLAFEANVEGGKLLVSSIDFHTDLENRPATRQLKQSLLDYAASEDFKPATNLELQDLTGLLESITVRGGLKSN